MITLRSAASLDLSTVERVAWDRQPVTVHPETLDRLARSREAMLDALDAGERVYGINTGMGYLGSRDLTDSEQRRHQRNLLLGRAVGSGPYLPDGEARTLLVAKLAGLLSGHAGVTAALCQFLTDRLNDGFVPAVPRRGMGSAGDIIALAHAFQTFAGVGYVLGEGGVREPAADALAERGVRPYEPQAKEGIALLAGAPGAVAVGLGRQRAATALAGQLMVSGACAIDALRAPLDPYSEAVGALSSDPLMVSVLDRLRDLLSDSPQPRRASQAPVSFRVLPQVQTHLERSIDRLGEDLGRALRSVPDSPVFIDGRFHSTGGFHALGIAAGMDALALALTHAAELAGQRMHRLLDRRFSGLADQLTPAPGPNAGAVVVHKRATGAISQARRLAAPVTIGLADTSLGQEDAMTFAFEGAERLRTLEELVREVVACELLVCRQAWVLRNGDVADGLRPVATRLAELVEPLDSDRPLGDDLDRIIQWLAGDPFRPLRCGGRSGAGPPT